MTGLVDTVWLRIQVGNPVVLDRPVISVSQASFVVPGICLPALEYDGKDKDRTLDADQEHSGNGYSAPER